MPRKKKQKNGGFPDEIRINVNATGPDASYDIGLTDGVTGTPEPESVVVTPDIEPPPAFRCRRCNCADIRGVMTVDLPRGAQRKNGTCRHCGARVTVLIPAEKIEA